MNKKIFLLGLALLVAGQLMVAQVYRMITVSADGSENSYTLTGVQRIIFEDNTMTVKMKVGADVKNIKRVSFDQDFSGINFSQLRINEVSGVGDDADKFYELINLGDVEISLEGCKIFYNANGSVGGDFPPNGNQGLTWTGKEDHVIQPGELLLLLGRYNATSNPDGAFTTGLTAERILMITLEDPDGNVIDQCIRAEDTGEYAIKDKSFSRIPDGTGPFYFTTPTPDEMNGTNATGLLLVPQTRGVGIKNLDAAAVFVFPNPVENYLTVTGVNKNVKINLLDMNGQLLQSVFTQDNATNIDVSSLQQGIYLLQMGEQVVKFIKK